ncbi:hypothetical protein ACO2Q0_07365 [Phenylobacterium sp. VNQ135]|uniref:hypothetical protein n=1 Tax=Phenylobacterium sp. VNQ135 TaxID=3400922 RepID=UPI003BFF97E3
MTPIRPNLPPQVGQPQQRAIDPARLAAQKAFFAAALGQAGAVPPPQAPAAAAPREAPRAAAAGPQEAQPQRILRPGSILDIRV